MNPSEPICRDEQRRMLVRKKRLNGLDYLEVDRIGDEWTLRVYFFGKAPQDLALRNILILGGRRVRNIRARRIEVCRVEDKEQDDCLVIFLDKGGDFSTYTLCLMEVDENGQPIIDGHWQGKLRYRPLDGLDPRYACLDFTFQAGCPIELDCLPAPPAVEAQREPQINYLAKDYASFRRLILDRLALTLPDWQERHVPDLGITLVELLAYTGDYLSYYQDAVATEAYLDTARLRISVRRHARLVDYSLHEGSNARAWLFIEAEDDAPNLDPATFFFAAARLHLPAGGKVTEDDLPSYPSGHFTIFEPLLEDPSQTLSFYHSHNELCFYAWGDRQCCLPPGTTSASLRGPIEPPLKAGDFLLLEEVLGPETGVEADADPAHRHVVRLTEVWENVDPLNDQRVVEVAWAEADALPFRLCISGIGRAPDCSLLEGISVARGNIILVDHGQTISEDLDPAPLGREVERCFDEGRVQVRRAPVRYRPKLRRAPLTFHQPLTNGQPAAHLLEQDVRATQPRILQLTDGQDVEWLLRPDLFNSQPDDPHVVVETDDDGRAHLRFGDGVQGQHPAGGTAFRARYRVGGGPQGNVGAGAIRYWIMRSGQTLNARLKPRNPLPASGGNVPESLAEARLTAPYAFRNILRRAIIPADYAAIVMRDFADQVQRAAAAFRWTGSWYEVLVAVDVLGGGQPEPALLEQIYVHLQRYRRIGHDVQVQSARYVPLEVGMTICVLPGFMRGHVRAAVLSALSAHNIPGGQGFFHPDRLTFGQAVYLSPLVAAVAKLPGVESVVITVFQRYGQPSGQEIEDGLLPLGPLEIARLDNDPSFPENGQLKLTLGGGR